LFSGWLLLGGVPILALVGLFVGQDFAVVSLLALWPAYLFFRVFTDEGRRRVAASADSLLERDSRPPILYLRLFEDDGKASPRAHMRVHKAALSVWTLRTYEERLAFALRRIGPLIAIGKPHEDLPTLGAARTYVPDRAWREKVDKEMRRAQLVVLRVGHSEGLLWELQRAVSTVRPERLVICLPETHRQIVYLYFRLSTSAVFPHGLPSEIGNADFLYFDSEWRPHLALSSNLKRLPTTIPAETDSQSTQQQALKSLGAEFASGGVAGLVWLLVGYAFLALLLVALRLFCKQWR
jgi:hypothetical protein